MTRLAFRGEILSFRADPDHTADDDSIIHHEDGLLVIENDRILQLGSAAELLASLPAEIEVRHYPHHLIMPGFIDSHIHLPQVDMIASHGRQLLEWLQDYTFPAERRFADAAVAAETSRFFLQQLMAAGTTTAMVFATIHEQGVHEFFTASEALGTRMICGRVMMDSNAPEWLSDDAQTSYDESRALIERWHGCGRQLYAVTPRFAITSSGAQLTLAGRLLAEFPDVYMQTHLSENADEIAAVARLYPDSCDYLDVYDGHGLVRNKCVFAHGLHLCQREHRRLHEARAGIAFCPTSNLFLGSGLLDIAALEAEQVLYGMATDVGGGTSFSMLQTLNEAYKVGQMRKQDLSALKAFYLATLGNARMLELEDHIGTLDAGTEADFIMIDYQSSPLMSRRIKHCKTLAERLFVLMMLGDDRAVQETWVAGNCVHQRQGCA